MANVKSDDKAGEVSLVVSAPTKSRVLVQVRQPGEESKSVTAVVFPDHLSKKLEDALEERAAEAACR